MPRFLVTLEVAKQTQCTMRYGLKRGGNRKIYHNVHLDKDAILDFFVANDFIFKRPKFQPCQTPPSVFPQLTITPQICAFFFKILILSQNVGSFASNKKGMDTFQC